MREGNGEEDQSRTGKLNGEEKSQVIDSCLNNTTDHYITHITPHSLSVCLFIPSS
jgi:hypothetical protein